MANSIARSDYHRKYYLKNKNIIKKRALAHYYKNRDERLKQVSVWGRNNTDKRTKHVARWRKKNPEKHYAYGQVQEAIKKGIIQRVPCEICGNSTAEAHHEDYTKPLEVWFLCVRHHNARHNYLKHKEDV